MFVFLPSVRILTSPLSRICPPNQDLFSYAFVFVLVLFIYVPTLLYYSYFIYININLSSVCVSIIFSPPFTFLSLFTSHVTSHNRIFNFVSIYMNSDHIWSMKFRRLSFSHYYISYYYKTQSISYNYISN